jgi:hypothetical protein
MIVRSDSPLRRLPASLNRKQMLFLDGIRVAAEIVDLTYTRLVETLLRLADTDSADSGRGIAIISAIQDTWSIIDSVHRLCSLLRRMPYLKQKAPGLQVFYRLTTTVEELRHMVQHLDSEINNLVRQGVPVWGTIQWLVLVNPTRHLIRACTIVAGSLFNATHPMQNPSGKGLRAIVDHVILTSGSTSVNLSDIFFAVGKLVESLERSLEPQFGDLPRHGSDMVVMMDMEPVIEQETITPTTPEPSVQREPAAEGAKLPDSESTPNHSMEPTR